MSHLNNECGDLPGSKLLYGRIILIFFNFISLNFKNWWNWICACKDEVDILHKHIHHQSSFHSLNVICQITIKQLSRTHFFLHIRVYEVGRESGGWLKMQEKKMKRWFAHICNLFSRREKFLSKDPAGNDKYAYAEYELHPCRYSSNSTNCFTISTFSFTLLLILTPDLGVVCLLWKYKILYSCLFHGTRHFPSYSIDLFLSILTL